MKFLPLIKIQSCSYFQQKPKKKPLSHTKHTLEKKRTQI